MPSFSYDIVCDYDKGEINNVYDQVHKEIASRYDFKGSSASIEWLSADKDGFKITGDSEFQIDSIIDIIRKRLAGRNQSQKILDVSADIVVSNLKSTKVIPFLKGIKQSDSKKITALIREYNPKLKCAIQGEAIRVSSSSKDDLQALMGYLRTHDFDFPLMFTNYR